MVSSHYLSSDASASLAVTLCLGLKVLQISGIFESQQWHLYIPVYDVLRQTRCPDLQPEFSSSSVDRGVQFHIWSLSHIPQS